MSFDSKKYHRDWMRKYRAKQSPPGEKREKKLLKQGKCPVCEMLLVSTYHTTCGYVAQKNRQIKD